MQAQMDDGTYSELREIGLDTLVREISLRSGTRKILLFESYDEQGRPTKELRRAWRRYRRRPARCEDIEEDS